MASNHEIATVRGWIRMGGIKVTREQQTVTAVYTNEPLAEQLHEYGVISEKLTLEDACDPVLRYRIAADDFARVFGADTLAIANSVDTDRRR